ncbi:MAG: GNAT family N-acetyltransferase [Proteobacteria bacterium]|nr:GNAT family N-acetyltransferase [Pseudomonadota bacterium]
MDTESTLVLLKALANEKRLQILQWLLSPVENFPPQNDGDLIEDGVCISYITDKVSLTQPTVTMHMKILGDAGLVTSKPIKNWVFYKPDRDAVDSALADLNQRLRTEIGAASSDAEIPPPAFTTSRLIIRPPETADIPSWQKNFVDYEVIRHLHAHIPWPYPENGVETHLNEAILPNQGKDKWVWVLCHKDQPEEVIGSIEIRRTDAGVGENDNRGFWLAQKFWGQGLMSEALVPVMNYAFTKLGFKSMVLSNATRNRRSSRVKKRHGARFVATAPARFVDPTYTEKEIWEITREEWEAYEQSL